MGCQGKTAIVTGAAGQGMGRSIALTLAREGARVVVNYRQSTEDAETIVRHIQSTGGEAMAVRADINEKDQCQKLTDATLEAYGTIDICLVGPGAGWHPEPVDGLNTSAALDDVTCELAPLYNLMPLVLPGMYERQWGRLIGLSLSRSLPSPAFAYNVAKSARTQALLAACGPSWPHGVTVNVIAPGPIEALPSLEQAVDLCEHGHRWLKRSNVTPQDIAEGVAWLCSEDANFVTGCELPFLPH